MMSALRRLIDVVGVKSDAGKARLAEIEALLKERPSVSRGQASETAPLRTVAGADAKQPRPQLRKVSGDD